MSFDSTCFPVSLISSIADLTIVTSFVVFRKKIKTKKVMELFFYIFVSHFLANIAGIFELSNDDSTSDRSRVASDVFFLAAIVWTVMVLLLLYSNVAFTKPIKISRVYHLVCWGIPVLSSALPLISDSSKSVWSIVSYYVVIYTCLLATAIISLQFLLHLHRVQLNTTAAKLKSIFLVVLAYPFVYFVCWLPSTIVDVMSILHPETAIHPTIVSFSTILACSTGFWSALVFWCTNEHARNMWYSALAGVTSSQASSLSTRTTGNMNTVRMKPIEICTKIAEQDVNNMVRRLSGIVMERMVPKYLSGLNPTTTAPVAVDATDDSARTGRTCDSSASPVLGSTSHPVVSGSGTGSATMTAGMADPEAPVQRSLGQPQPQPAAADTPTTPTLRAEGFPGLAWSESARFQGPGLAHTYPQERATSEPTERGSVRPTLPVKYGRPFDTLDV